MNLGNRGQNRCLFHLLRPPIDERIGCLSGVSGVRTNIHWILPLLPKNLNIVRELGGILLLESCVLLERPLVKSDEKEGA